MSKKFGVVDSYYSILTSGPLSGRPTYFIQLSEFRTSKISMKKLAKRINKECASHMVHLSGDGIYNEVLLTWLFDNNFVVAIDLYSSNKAPEGFDFSLFAHKLAQVHVNIDTEDLQEEIDQTAFIFRYLINKTESLAPDGLPKNMYRSEQMLRIVLSPSTIECTARCVEICKYYGYYLDIDYHHYIGIR